jgi:glyoxylase-like metal-dependent hydrolase (beta-lactamase superfamily II)
MIRELRAFEGGYCRQLLALVDRRSWRWARFPAVFLALRHDREGWVLVDTGYGERFRAATQTFPQRFYRWATPVTPAGGTRGLLARGGIDSTEIRHVIVTHFHADHVGGLAEFPEARVHFHADALDPLRGLSSWRQVRAAFLASLIPEWLGRQAQPVPPEAFRPAPDLPFPVHDLFGDGSIGLVPLPGHAPGQLGIIFDSAGGRELYAADAYWRRVQITGGVEPFAPVMSLQWDAPAYRQTVGLLREVHREGRYRTTACHDADTSRLLNGLRMGTAASP